MLSNDTTVQQIKVKEIFVMPNKPSVPNGTLPPMYINPPIYISPPIYIKSPINAKPPIDTKLLVNTKDLMQMLSCGKPMAIKIGENAHAKICIGRKILWNVECVKKYLNSIAE